MRLLEIHATELKAAVSVESPRFLASIDVTPSRPAFKDHTRAVLCLGTHFSVSFSSRFFRCLLRNCLPLHFSSFSRRTPPKAVRHKVQSVAQQSLRSGDRIIMQISIYKLHMQSDSKLHQHQRRAHNGSMEREKY